MRALRSALLLAGLSGLPLATRAAEGAHGLPSAAPVLFKLGFFQVTNSMVVTWIVAVALILGARAATRSIRAVPEGAQNFWEWLVESLHDFLEGIIGPDLVKKTFWFFATIFIFILAANWFGLIPGVGSIGWGHPEPDGSFHHLSEPIFRGTNADLNMTLAMAMVFFACWTVWALQANGAKGFVLHIFGPKGDTAGALKILMIGVFLVVGLLEVVSILFRPVSLSFRLYGNVFAGESMLETMAILGGAKLGWLLPIPFYFLELLVGLVQALVFMLLTSVFTLLICQHEDDHGHGHAAPAKH
ncbi:MAG: F0F1 ATP synthase subunit A [Verrucomicrobiae bacterium]|nr:F0F1 ATP synthase subunit A [Verrucomicrobiae bacterium]